MHWGGGIWHLFWLHTAPCPVQFWHARPPAPQDAFWFPATHRFPMQQPGQLPGPHDAVTVQRPPMAPMGRQISPGVHVSHARPFTPHAP